MGAFSATYAQQVLNCLLPTGTGGVPGTWTALTAGVMYVRLNSTLSTISAEGTQLPNGNGYVTNGLSLGTTPISVAAVNGSLYQCTLPYTALSWTAGTAWTIESMDITDSTPHWIWFGPFNGQPIGVASGNTFQIAANAVTVQLS